MINSIAAGLIVILLSDGCVGEFSETRYKNVIDGQCSGCRISSTVANLTVSHCALRASHDRMTSFNYRIHRNGSSKCIVLENSNMSYKLETKKSYKFYKSFKVDPCEPNPCLFEGKCSINTNHTFPDFMCECNFPTSGDRCEKDLVCTNCSRLNDLVIFLFNHQKVTQIDAAARCREMGYVLHMPKTQAVAKFTREYMGILHQTDKTSSYAYWIGVNRSKTSAKWLFLDNTELGDLQEWGFGRPLTELCVLMTEVVQNPDNFKWYDNACNAREMGMWQAYFVCEKRYDFFLGLN